MDFKVAKIEKVFCLHSRVFNFLFSINIAHLLIMIPAPFNEQKKFSFGLIPF